MGWALFAAMELERRKTLSVVETLLDQMGLICLMPLDLKTLGKMRSLDDRLSSVD
ncbi:hypothetical protein ACLOJK_006938 [Asimina triloba]